MPTDEEFQQRARQIVAAVRAKGPARPADGDDAYFVSVWEDTGMARGEAIRLAQDPLTLFLALILEEVGLEAILADRHATSELKKCLQEQDPRVRRGLAEYVTPTIARRKPGPKPRKGGYKGDQALALRERGLTFGQIAKEMWDDPNKRNLASALVSQAKRRRDNAGLSSKPESPK